MKQISEKLVSHFSKTFAIASQNRKERDCNLLLTQAQGSLKNNDKTLDLRKSGALYVVICERIGDFGCGSALT
jgi:hypothetical protein